MNEPEQVLCLFPALELCSELPKPIRAKPLAQQQCLTKPIRAPKPTRARNKLRTHDGHLTQIPDGKKAQRLFRRREGMPMVSHNKRNCKRYTEIRNVNRNSERRTQL